MKKLLVSGAVAALTVASPAFAAADPNLVSAGTSGAAVLGDVTTSIVVVVGAAMLALTGAMAGFGYAARAIRKLGR